MYEFSIRSAGRRYARQARTQDVAQCRRRSRGPWPRAIVLLVLSMPLWGCGPTDRAGHAERAPGVTVDAHWAELERIEDPLERTVARAEFVRTLGPEDVQALRELVSGGFRGQRSVDHLILMNAWASLDPEGAVTRALGASAAPGVAALKDTVLLWASIDPETAAAELELNDAEVRRALVQGWSASGVPGLGEFVLSYGTTQIGQHLIGAYAAELAFQGGADAVEAWIDETRGRKDVDPFVIVHVHRKGLVAIATVAPEAAIAYCERHCKAAYAEFSMPGMVDRLSRVGYAKRAVLWVADLEGAPIVERRNAGRTAFMAWFKADREAALAWAETARVERGTQPWFEGIARFALRSVTIIDPEHALSWVSLLPERDREDALISIGRRWIKVEPEAGEAWLESSPLDEAARAKARTPLRRRG